MLSTRLKATDHFNRTADLSVERSGSVSVCHRRREKRANGRRVNPTVAIVVEMGIKEVDIDARSVFEFVIHITGEAVAGAIIPIFADIFSVIRWEERPGRRRVIHKIY